MDALDATEPTEPRQIPVRVFGQSLALWTSGATFLEEDSLWRLHHIYQRYLASHLMASEGTLLDIGAGFGALAVPFAQTMPGWTVWAFEPDAAAFAALERNREAFGLANLHCVNAAVRGGLAVSEAQRAALAQGDGAALAAACETSPFRQASDKPGFVEAAQPEDEPRPGMDDRKFATVPAAALAALAPTAVKVVAPGAEQGILTALEPRPAHIFGEMWQPVTAGTLIRPGTDNPQIHLPLAGTPLILRHGQAIPAKHPAGLDVVVALYNNSEFVAECVGSIVDNAHDEIQVVVVDDGSTDDSADVVRQTFGDDPRVRLLQKANGGCASARNHGRRHSNAAHITFVDSDDVVEPDFFPKLLELAHYSGSEIVQGRFEKLEQGPDGARLRHRSYEDETLAHLGRIPFGSDQYFVAPAHDLIVGQPTIWRRIYRRDFLDHRDIWFPEHIRAFDDQIFQILTLYLARDVYARDDCAYLYRQHPGQDIKAGDERWFYSLEMFRLVVKRAIAEGWNDLVPVLRSYANTVNWIHRGLRDDLKGPFLEGAGELWAYMELSLGPAAFGPVHPGDVAAWDFRYYVDRTRARLKGLPPAQGWIHLDASALHPAIQRARHGAG